MGVDLSGGDGDGATGLRAVTKRGGVALVQDPQEAIVPSMPRAAIKAAHPVSRLPTAEIAQRVRAFCCHRAQDAKSMRSAITQT